MDCGERSRAATASSGERGGALHPGTSDEVGRQGFAAAVQEPAAPRRRARRDGESARRIRARGSEYCFTSDNIGYLGWGEEEAMRVTTWAEYGLIVSLHLAKDGGESPTPSGT